jgi:uncharacterized membrane protein
MRRHNLDVILAIIVAICNVGWSLLPIRQPIIGTLLALPLLFVIPGYLLTDMLLQKRPPGIAHRIVLSLTVSLCMVLLSGFLLNLLPAGLNARSWGIYLGGLNALLGLLALLRRRKAIIYRVQARSVRLKFSGFVLFGLALVVMIVSLDYSVISLANQPHPGFTQLWLLPSEEVNNTWQLRLGVRSDELAPVTYNVTMNVNHTRFKGWSSITLKPEQEWDQFVSLSGRPNNSMYVQVQLYRADKAGLEYKEVHTTLYKQKRAL